MDDSENNQESYIDLLKKVSKGIKKITPEDIGEMSEEQKENLQYIQERLGKEKQGE